MKHLTSKCLKDFKKWYFEVYCVENGYGLMRFFALKKFKEDTIAEQYGVFEEFFDSVGINLCIDMNVDHEMIYTGWFDWVVVVDLEDTDSGFAETRDECRMENLVVANIKYNENK